ncbi:MAG: diaminopimelate epimerase [Clostridiales bacterium]|nr:diaminopimelate epimerase [Clostridiales bacterium]
MKFTKMHGIGNDYIYVNCFQERVENPSELAIRLSDRHFGIGSDGLILIKPSDRADFQMEMYNADGSLGAMCGNGIRCVAKYVYDYGLTDQTRISVETASGIKYLELTVEWPGENIPEITHKVSDLAGTGKIPETLEKGVESACGKRRGTVRLVRVDMGAPILEPERIPVLSNQSGIPIVSQPIQPDGTIGEGIYSMTCVSMGNPHCIVPVEDVDGLDIEKIGPLFENCPRFPDRINTEFIRVIDRQTVQMRVWERGSGETLACGTGACAVAVACALNGWTQEEITVKLRGGDLQIKWDREKNTVFMTGPATIVFEGEIVF